jgi:N-acetylneuraminic acid mutarotase
MSANITRPLLAAAFTLAPAAVARTPVTTALPPVPDAFGFAGAFAGIHRGQLIACGGANFPDGVMPWDGGTKVWSDRIFILDLQTSNASWKPSGKLPNPNGYGVSLTVPDGILLIGGSDKLRHFADVRLLSLDTEGKPTFKNLPSLPKPVAQMCGALVGSKVHLCGGIVNPADTTALADHWILDLDAPAKGWIEGPRLPGPGRILSTAAAVRGDLIVVGGCSLKPDDTGKAARTYLTDAWRFTGTAWKRLADLPRAATAAASPAPVSGDSCYIISGDDGSQAGLPSPASHRGFTPEILRYDGAANQWSSAGKLDVPPPVTLPTAPWKTGVILFNGEVRPGVRTPDVIHFSMVP